MKHIKLKKLTALLSLAAILFSIVAFAGCGGGEDTEENENNNTITVSNSETEAEESTDIEITTVSQEKILAAPIDYNSIRGTYPGAASGEFQSITEYCEKSLTFKEVKEDGACYTVEFSGKADAIKALEEYKKLMTSGKMHFEASGEAKKEKSGTTYYGFGFDYNGAMFIPKSNLINYSENDTPCTISFSYYTDGKNISGILCWPKELTCKDLGFRSGGKEENGAPQGPSACAGLKRTAGGTYETDDGRFSLRMDETVIYTNGNIFGGKATLILDRKKTCHLVIETTDGKDSTVFSFPYSDFNSGAYYDNTALSLYSNPVKDKSPTGFSTEKATLFRYINEEWHNPTYQDSAFENATVRIVYLSNEENVAVFYIYSETDIQQEIMCVLDITKAKKPDSNTSVIPVETTVAIEEETTEVSVEETIIP